MAQTAENLNSRNAILRAAYVEIHRKGYHAASLHDILRRAGLSKGALYHHFSSKQELAYVVVDEILEPYIRERWVDPLKFAVDPVSALQKQLESAAHDLTPEDVLHGCALNNLAQEMSPVDAGFRMRLNQVFLTWRNGISDAFRRGQAAGMVRSDIEPDATSAFVVAAIEGCVGMAKNAQSKELLISCGLSFNRFLECLRPEREVGGGERITGG